ncbi:MAG: hypothetical protein ACM3ZC_05895 [Bacteroidota bacterium]
MQKVITSIEIRQYEGMKEAVFPAGAIITPAARDWAKERGIRIVCGPEIGSAEVNDARSKPGREELLRRVVVTMAEEFKRCGRPLEKEALGAAVRACLDRLNAR